MFFNMLSSIAAEVFLSVELEDNGNDSWDTVHAT